MEAKVWGHEVFANRLAEYDSGAPPPQAFQPTNGTRSAVKRPQPPTLGPAGNVPGGLRWLDRISRGRLHVAVRSYGTSKMIAPRGVTNAFIQDMLHEADALLFIGGQLFADAIKSEAGGFVSWTCAALVTNPCIKVVGAVHLVKKADLPSTVFTGRGKDGPQHCCLRVTLECFKD